MVFEQEFYKEDCGQNMNLVDSEIKFHCMKSRKFFKDYKVDTRWINATGCLLGIKIKCRCVIEIKKTTDEVQCKMFNDFFLMTLLFFYMHPVKKGVWHLLTKIMRVENFIKSMDIIRCITTTSTEYYNCHILFNMQEKPWS